MERISKAASKAAVMAKETGNKKQGKRAERSRKKGRVQKNIKAD